MCTQTLKIAALLLSLFAVAHGQVISSGACPTNINVIDNFNVASYLGKWYEYAKYPVYFEGNGVCITAQYALKDDGNVNVVNTQVNEAGEVESIVGFASVVSNAKLMVTFPVSPAASASTNYWVLDTDYKSYTVVYSCQPVGKTQHSTIVWILTRDPVPCGNVIDQAVAVLQKNNISLNELVLTKQIGCPATTADC